MKLPITPVLYLASLGFLGGIVLSVYEYTKNKKKLVVPNKAIRAEITKIQGDVRKKGARDNKNWNYAAAGFWENFKVVNLTGKVEKKKVEGPKVVENKEPKPTDIPDLSTILQVVCITNAGDDTGIVIKYVTDVEVPPELIPKATSPITSTMPKGRQRPGRRNRPAPTTPLAVNAPLHHLKIGDGLWPKYAHVKLKSVDDNARFATFEIQIDEKKDKDGNYPTQRQHKPALQLPQNVLDQLYLFRKGVAGATGTGGADTGNPNAARPDQPAGPVWVDTPETTVSRAGKVNVSRKDQSFLENNGPKIFTDDVHMRDYSGGSGKHRVRGVQVRKLSGRVRQFGVNEGDVIISINGIPVTGMANAKKTGRRLYNKGVRTFRAEILRMGQVIERTYTFKK